MIRSDVPNYLESLQVIKDLNNLRDCLTTPATMRVHLAVNVNTLPPDTKPDAPWKQELLPKNIQTCGDRYGG